MINGVRFTIKSVNKEKNLKRILNLGKISSIKLGDGRISFCVTKSNCGKIEKLFKVNNIEILDKRGVGFFPFLKRTILRWGVIIPILLFAFVGIIANMYIFNYEVSGNELVETNEILNVLAEKNIKGIIKKGSINKAGLESAIRDLDKVSMVSIVIKGNTLVVSIKEKVYNMEYENRGEYEPLKSNFNGIITEISIIQGTALVKAGQTVKVGQSLVAPYVENTSGQTLSVIPMADIKADVFYTTITHVPNTKIEMIDTGNTVTNKQITLFGLTLYSSDNKCDYSTYRQEEIEEDMSTGLLLPIKINTIVYYEQIEKQTDDYFNKNKEQIIIECQQKTRQFVGSCEIIKEEYKTITQIADLNQITYTVVVNKSIC